jgi:hypothetical protein
MSQTLTHTTLAGCVLCAALPMLAIPGSPAHAATQVAEHRAASPQGAVEIINVAGSIDVQGWDRAEVDVSGTAGKDVERVEVSGDANRISVRVVLPQHLIGFNNDGAANLVIHVPINSSVSTSLVSADLKITGVRGDVKLQTVSGGISGDAGGNVRANSVSGNVRLTATAAKSIEVKAISGDVTLTGGDAETEVTTVSGTAKVNLGTVPRARLKTISGEISADLAMGTDAQIEAESISGEVRLNFPSEPNADFDVQTLSGDINNCFGPKPVEPRHGPGSRLQFKTGDNNARVRVSTKSGSVQMCTKNSSGDKAKPR